MVLTSLAFYPSLAYNLLRNKVQPNKWPWYNRIDENLLLGALPFKSMRDELVKTEQVGGVVCCTEEYELKAAYEGMCKEDWEALGVRFHAIPMQDFTGTATRPQLVSAVEFIEDVAKTGKSVYVHCKAGRTRSATVASCYLIKKHNWLPNVAVEFLKDKRPQVHFLIYFWMS
ncbi:hypothetical protein WR25_00657 [Diploscapter pachys]|uniref:Phosphatidylglycerophosphatase and protein-tyrosine phosphatase 1 n=1 Tax=Diploscapter pachys TaxID=2018661 RepID=A0A2A2JJ71_9BILA|nr:hypothetical protein WR25_00657 [Diploscapter pachys]